VSQGRSPAARFLLEENLCIPGVNFAEGGLECGFYVGMAHLEKQRYAAHPTELEVLLTVSRVCDVLCVSRPTLYRLVRRGELRPTRVGDRLRFLPSEIREYLERQREAVEEAMNTRDKEARQGRPDHTRSPLTKNVPAKAPRVSGLQAAHVGLARQLEAWREQFSPYEYSTPLELHQRLLEEEFDRLELRRWLRAA
jgi:excisionase family DNA binding protein